MSTDYVQGTIKSVSHAVFKFSHNFYSIISLSYGKQYLNNLVRIKQLKGMGRDQNPGPCWFRHWALFASCLLLPLPRCYYILNDKVICLAPETLKHNDSLYINNIIISHKQDKTSIFKKSTIFELLLLKRYTLRFTRRQ